MKPSERDRLTLESHQALLGIPGTEDKGLVGDVKEMKGELKVINSRVTKVEVKQEERNKPSKKAMGGGIVASIGIVVALLKAFLTSGN